VPKLTVSWQAALRVHRRFRRKYRMLPQDRVTWATFIKFAKRDGGFRVTALGCHENPHMVYPGTVCPKCKLSYFMDAGRGTEITLVQLA
jgi:hypothetical protein